MSERRIELTQRLLGVKPYILITVDAVDENDDPELLIEYGGGIETDVVAELLAYTAERLGLDFRDYLEVTEPDDEPADFDLNIPED